MSKVLRMERPAATVGLLVDDVPVICEALRIAQQTILETRTQLQRTWPTSLMCERLQQFAEQMADTLERVGAL